MTTREKYQSELRTRLQNKGEQFTFQLFKVGTFRAVVLKDSPASKALSKKYKPIREVIRPAPEWLNTWGECGELGELAAVRE